MQANHVLAQVALKPTAQTAVSALRSSKGGSKKSEQLQQGAVHVQPRTLQKHPWIVPRILRVQMKVAEVVGLVAQVQLYKLRQRLCCSGRSLPAGVRLESAAAAAQVHHPSP
jgi:hypothetical protein